MALKVSMMSDVSLFDFWSNCCIRMQSQVIIVLVESPMAEVTNCTFSAYASPPKRPIPRKPRSVMPSLSETPTFISFILAISNGIPRPLSLMMILRPFSSIEICISASADCRIPASIALSMESEEF